MLADFRRLVLYEMAPGLALRKHFFQGNVDAIDAAFGLESYYRESTKKEKGSLKFKRFVTDFYGNGDILPFQLELGFEKINSDEQLSVWRLGSDPIVKRRYDRILKDIGLSEDDLDKIGNDEKAIAPMYDLVLRFNAALRTRSDKELLRHNLAFLDEHATYERKAFKNRVYFEINDPIFSYKIAFKNGRPKIMYINMKP